MDGHLWAIVLHADKVKNINYLFWYHVKNKKKQNFINRMCYYNQPIKYIYIYI
jgi:hypothetical protein